MSTVLFHVCTVIFWKHVQAATILRPQNSAGQISVVARSHHFDASSSLELSFCLLMMEKMIRGAGVASISSVFSHLHCHLHRRSAVFFFDCLHCGRHPFSENNAVSQCLQVFREKENGVVQGSMKI